MYFSSPRGDSGLVRLAALLALVTAGLSACGGGGGGSNPPPTFSIGGTVSGLAGSGLVLQNSGGNNLAVSANGSFQFSNLSSSGATYAVTVLTQPTSPAQTCTVANGSGSVTANVSSVTVSCTTNTYSVGGTVSGLAGSGLVLRNNGGNDLTIAGNGNFTISSAVTSGTAYAITILTQPSSPTQTCSVANGTGTVGAANVTVAITCSAVTYTVGGTVSGLTGAGLVLQNNAGNNLAIAANGAFAFATPVASGGAYAVTVLTQPSGPAQTCTVSSAAGTVSANVTNVTVTCALNAYTIGGTVSGLVGSGLVLQNNGGGNRAVSGNGAFSFVAPVAAGGAYAVTVLTQPSSPSQTCVVTNGSGTVVNANVTNVAIACTTSTYTIGGTISGLSGTGLVLQLNGANNFAISSGSSSFAFASTPLATGAAYAVTVLTQPASPTQTCSVANGAGTVGAANVTNVAITCSSATHTVGGTVSGLASGSSVVLQNNAGDNLAVAANGSFTFVTPVATGGAYAVTVLTHPVSPARICAVAAGTGIVAATNVTNVVVTCRSRNVYVSNSNDDDGVGVFTIADTGVLTAGTHYTTAPDDAAGVAVSPSGSHLFLSLRGSAHQVKIYLIAHSGPDSLIDTGNFGLVPANPDPSGPGAILAHPSERFIHVLDAPNGTIRIFTFNKAASTLTDFGFDTIQGLYALVMEPSGKFLYASSYDNQNVTPFTINQTDGSLALGTSTAALGTQASEMALAMDPAGRFLFAAHQRDSLIGAYRINGTTGGLTFSNSQSTQASPFVLGVSAMVVEPTGKFLYAANADGNIWGYAIDQTSGAIAPLAGSPFAGTGSTANSVSLAVDASGKFLYKTSFADGAVSFYTINSTTGAVAEIPGSPVVPTNGGLTGIAIE